MSGSDKSVEYAVTADPSGFLDGMDKAQAAAKQTAKQIQSSFQMIEAQMSQMSGALKSVTGLFATLTAVAAGGAAFKEVIGASVAWTGEAKKLSMQLGITTERASVMMVAMRHMGLDSEVVTMAAGKMSKQIATNSQAFDKLGVSVKDSTNHYRPTLDIMGEVNTKLKEIKNPIEQNIAGTQIYGKSWNEVRGILKLTTEELKNSEQKTKDLGLVVGDEGVAQSKKYKESLSDMKLVMTSLEVQAGAAMLPAFVKIGSWLSGAGPASGKIMGVVMESLSSIMGMVGEVVMDLWGMVRSGFSAIGGMVDEVMGTQGPDAMGIFVNVLKLVELAFQALKVAVKAVIEYVSGLIEVWVSNLMRMAAVAERTLHLDFAGAKQAWATGTAIIEDIARKHASNLVKIASDGKDKVDEIIMRGPAAGPAIKDKKLKNDDPTYDFGKDAKEGKEAKDPSRVATWEAKLAIDKDGFERAQQLAGTMQEFSKASERDYWKKILDTTSMSVDEKIQVNRKYLGLEHDLRKDGFDSEIAGEKAKLEDFKSNFGERIVIATRIYGDMKARYGADSKEAIAAMGDIKKEVRKLAEQTLATDKIVTESARNKAMAEIEFAQQDAELQVNLGQITAAKLLELEQGFEAKRYQIKMQALQEEQAMLQASPDHNPTALAALHAQLEEVERQHQMRLKQIKDKATVEQNKNTQAMYGSIQSGMQGVIAGTLNGTMKMRDIFKSMFGVVVSAVVDMLAKTAAEWAMNLIVGNGLASASAAGQIAANAGVAGAAATASAAAIPLIGWTIAPEAGIAASAAAMAFMPMASARNGYDIPAGINPITQLHEREMVLPAAQADAVRSMAEGGGTSGQTINYHDHTGRLSPADIRKNVRVIADALKDHAKKS